MARPFVIVTATDSQDPVVGANPVARSTLRALHAALIETAVANGLTPYLVHTCAEEDGLTGAPYDRPEVVKVGNYYSGVFPLFDMLIVLLTSTNIAESAGVYFDDALNFDVEVFVECWRRAYPARPLPPFFGVVHSANLNGYGSANLLDWRAQGQAQKLEMFTELAATSRGLAQSLKLDAVIAPYFGLREGKTAVSVNSAGLCAHSPLKLNWIYSFSQVDRYDQFILLANGLRRIIEVRQLAITKPKPDEVSTEKLTDIPAAAVPVIYSPEIPEGVAKPNALKEKVNPGTHVPYDVFTRDRANNRLCLPEDNSVTVSFQVAAENDYRLLRLAEMGYMVLAPNSGIYREALDPLFLYDPRWLTQYNFETPEQVTRRVSEEFYQRLIDVRNLWRQRIAPRAAANGERYRVLRRTVRAQIAEAPAVFVDRVFSALNLSV